MGTGLCVGQFSCFEINNLKEERTVLTPGFSIFGPWLLGSVTSGPEVKKNIFLTGSVRLNFHFVVAREIKLERWLGG